MPRASGSTGASILACVAATLLGCDNAGGPTPLVTRTGLERGPFEEIVACRLSHEHELRHVRSVADPASAALFRQCVLGNGPCPAGFPEGALLVKYEYDRAGCIPSDLLSYTVSRRLAPGGNPDGKDWHWQRLDPDFKVVDDGAPPVCLTCHINHCSPPDGFDLRCKPD